MKLIAAAELAAGVNTYKARPFVWRQSILRPAKRAKQASMCIFAPPPHPILLLFSHLL